MFVYYIEITKDFFFVFVILFFVGLDWLLKHFFKLLYKPTLNKVDLLTNVVKLAAKLDVGKNESEAKVVEQDLAF